MEVRHLDRREEKGQDKINVDELGLSSTVNVATHPHTPIHTPWENLILHESCEENWIFSQGDDPQHISHL